MHEPHCISIARGVLTLDSERTIAGNAVLAEPPTWIRAGLLGRGILQSRTPRMHEAEGSRLGLRYDYRLFDFDQLGLDDSDLPDLVGRLRTRDYSGINVTHPFKERIIGCLDRLSPDAESIGAVNTVVFDGDAAIGHNTDCWGFAESFRRGLDQPRLDAVVLVGAGGAGMAVAKALLDLGVHRIEIADVSCDRAERLAGKLQAAYCPDRVASVTDIESALADADGLVNATPVGMAKYPGTPVEPAWLRPGHWVVDIVYFPAETELLRAARTIGCQVLPGSGMAIFQAVMAFSLIAGAEPDPEHMAFHFRDG